MVSIKKSIFCIKKIVSKIAIPVFFINLFLLTQITDISISKLFLPILILKIFIGLSSYYIVFKHSPYKYLFANLGYSFIRIYIIVLIIEFSLFLIIFKLIKT